MSSLRTLTTLLALLGCLAAVLPPLIPVSDPARTGLWPVVVALCIALFASTWLRVPRWLLLAAGWLMVAVVVHLAFGLTDLVALLVAMPLAVAVLSLLAGQVSRRTRKVLYTTHMAVSGIWLGISLVMVTLAVFAVGADRVEVAHAHFALLEHLDVTILPWSCLASIMSGIAVSLTGKWGVAKHYWVLAKFTLAVGVLACAFGFIHDLVVTAAEDSERLLREAGRLEQLDGLAAELVTSFGFAAALVLTATILSVYKPWGRTVFGRRETRRAESLRKGRGNGRAATGTAALSGADRT